MRLCAAHDVPVQGLLSAAPLGQYNGNGHVIVEKAGGGQAGLDHLAGLPHQGIWRTFVHPHGQNRLGGLHVFPCRKAHVRDFVGGIRAIDILAAHHQDGPHGKACEGGGSPAVPDLDQLVAFEEEAFQDFLGGLAVQAALPLLLLEIGIGDLVKAAEAAGVRRGLDVERQVDEPDGLKRLVKILRGTGGDGAAVLRDGAQLCLPFGVLLLVRQFICPLGIPLCQTDHRPAGDDTGLPEVDLFLEFLVFSPDRGQLFLALLDDAFQPHGQQFAVVRHSLCRGAPPGPHTDQLVLQGVSGVFRQKGAHFVEEGFPAPVVLQAGDDLLLVLVADVHLVSGTGGELVHLGDEPVGGLVFREHQGGPRGAGHGAHDELVLPDVDLDPLHHVGKHLRPENGNGVSGILLVSFRGQKDPFCGNGGFCLQKAIL